MKENRKPFLYLAKKSMATQKAIIKLKLYVKNTKRVTKRQLIELIDDIHKQHREVHENYWDIEVNHETKEESEMIPKDLDYD